jgi:hypothetical protein
MSPIPEDFGFLFVTPELAENSLALHVHGFGVAGGNGKVVTVHRPLPVPFIGFLFLVFYGQDVRSNGVKNGFTTVRCSIKWSRSGPAPYS